MHAPFIDGFHHPTCNDIWTKRQGRQPHRGYVCAQWARRISSAGPVLLVRASSILRAMEEESQSEWACSVAEWTAYRVSSNHEPESKSNHYNSCEVFRAGNMGEKRQRRLCLVSSEKCWVTPWQFLGSSCTHLPYHSHPAKQGAECELLLSLYHFISPYSLTGWGCKPQGLLTLMHRLSLLGNNPFFSPSFSLFLVLCSSLNFSGWITSLFFKRLAYSWSGQVIRYRIVWHPVSRELSCLDNSLA